MASATSMPTMGIQNMSLDKQNSTPARTNEDSPSPSSAQFWTDLIRKNLITEQAIQMENNDGEDTVFSIDEEIMNAPRRKSARDALAHEVAARLYPDLAESLAAIIKYEKDIVVLRSMVLAQRQAVIAEATERNNRVNWVKRITKQGWWDEIHDSLPLTGAPSLPMPVEQSGKESLAPFFAHLQNGGTVKLDPASSGGVSGVEPYYDTELVEFEKGVLYSDGRIDLCKMVTGPRNIGDLMESLKSNTFSKHFLLGNNIIGSTGAKAIADFIGEIPERFETWYLAGNCIDSQSFTQLVNSMVMSTTITNVWLKRNPLGPSAANDVFRLITQAPNLRTLDLDQTELGDEGVAELFRQLSVHSQFKPLALRNIYLNACGISTSACEQIARFLRSPHCTVESLYLSNNPIGDGAANVLAIGLAQNNTLQRLSLQSCGLKDAGAIAIASVLVNNPTITALDLGQAYATEDLGMRFNWLTNASAPDLISLVQTTKLQYLNIAYTPMTQPALNTLLTAITTSESLLWFFAKSLVTGGRDHDSVKAGQEHARLYKLVRERLHENVKAKYEGMAYEAFENGFKRFLISPKDVRLIDSVYRNRDAGAARRGEKRLEKWWGEGDETLRMVQEGTLA
ncbi:uncharacterized protein LTR77_010392 [Saxophila tyrrhenica]|uniref:RNI-like protein n=1 Tax=Saxophila tyrrhenica TaxID=1690608 RepID=A0AAV9NVR9_9PEZI|nr:hypothetical protein LTR77_010392 [Saxophila tyrrhenica]